MTEPSRTCRSCGGEKVSIYARVCHLCGAADEPEIAADPLPSESTTEPTEATGKSPPPRHSATPVEVNQTNDRVTPTSSSAIHATVWVVAFIPIAGLLLDLWLVSQDISAGWSIIPVLVANVLLIKKDKYELARLRYDTGPLESGLTGWIIPVYLFKRVAVAGGGYGYAVLWMATFSIMLLFPYIQQNDGSSSVQGSERIEVVCDGASCAFTNTSDRSGATMCVNMSFQKGPTKITSELVCSGPMNEFDSVQKPMFFIGQQPIELCLGKDFSGDWEDCVAEVIVR